LPGYCPPLVVPQADESPKTQRPSVHSVVPDTQVPFIHLESFGLQAKAFDTKVGKKENSTNIPSKTIILEKLKLFFFIIFLIIC
jgi:hypothetical protein